MPEYASIAVDHCRVEVGAGAITGTGCVAAAPWLPFRMRDLAVSFYRCPIDLFLRQEHPRSGNENLVTIVETLARLRARLRHPAGG